MGQPISSDRCNGSGVTSLAKFFAGTNSTCALVATGLICWASPDDNPRAFFRQFLYQNRPDPGITLARYPVTTHQGHNQAMDPLTQATLGASLSETFADRQRLTAACAVGALGGIAPDIDIFFGSSQDPILFLEFHRQFTHSLAFIPVGALLCAMVCHYFVSKRLNFAQNYWFCLLGYATHGLLDACTSYGTQLLWPFSDYRVAWNLVSVIDPLLSVPAFALVLLAFFRRRPIYGRVALAWVLIYLGLGLMQRERAIAAGYEIAAQRDHQPTRLEAKPGFGNLLVWKVIYESQGRYYVDAVRPGVDVHLYPGESIARLDRTRDLTWLGPDDQQSLDIERFRWFSSDFLAIDEDPSRSSQNPAWRVMDIRYSNVPNEIDPLWSIQLDPQRPPTAHVGWLTNRNPSPTQRAKLFAMLAGQGIDGRAPITLFR